MNGEEQTTCVSMHMLDACSIQPTERYLYMLHFISYDLCHYHWLHLKCIKMLCILLIGKFSEYAVHPWKHYQRFLSFFSGWFYTLFFMLVFFLVVLAPPKFMDNECARSDDKPFFYLVLPISILNFILLLYIFRTASTQCLEQIMFATRVQWIIMGRTSKGMMRITQPPCNKTY